MNFGNMIIPLLVFGAPLAALIVFALRGGRRSDAERRAGLILFGLMSLTSLIGLFQFELPVKMEFLLPLSTDNSGYFEPTFVMVWTRYVWLLLSSLVLTGLVLFDGDSAFGGSRGPLRFLFLSGTFLFLALAYLSENTLLTLMFVEITVFLLHSFGLEMGGEEGELERISYFKRNSFLFLGLLAMLGLTAANLFTNSSIVLLGMVLYVIAFILAKHNFSDWRYVPLTMLQAATAFFLLSRVIHEDMSGELWVPLSVLFASATVLFCALSFLATNALNASFWMIFAVLGYLLLLRFSSNKPEEAIWGSFEAMGLLASYALSLVVRFARNSRQSGQPVALLVFAVLLLAMITGVLPMQLGGGHAESRDTLLKISVLGILAFLISLVAAKALAMAGREEKGPDARSTFAWAMLPAAIVVLIQIGALVRLHDGFSGLLDVPGEVLSDISLLVRIAALLVGSLAGYFLGTNARLLQWSSKKEKRMEDLFPRIDPVIVRWNQSAVSAPERAIEWVSERTVTMNSRATSALQEFDRRVFAEKFPGGFSSYGSSLSHLARLLHSGNVRFYLLFGTLLTMFAGALFLLGGK